MAARKLKENYYNDNEEFLGNAVRKRRVEKEIIDYNIQKRRKERQQIEVRERRAEAARLRRLENAQGINLISCILLVAVVAVMFVLCTQYLKLHDGVGALKKQIAQVEADTKEMQIANDSAYQEVNSTVDLKKVYNIAVKELGMVFAQNNQIITYSDNEATYVRQYSSIPESPRNNFFDDIIGYLGY